jgi:uncharacterized MAPEG superfamily protein
VTLTGMTVELTVLALAALLAVVQLFLFAIPANRTLGSDYLAGPRDEKRELTGRTARLQRAYNNHLEGLLLFTVAVVVTQLGAASTPFTQTCAWVYLAARVLYVPLYAIGHPWARSAVWSVGFFATVAMLVAALI